MVVAGGLVTTRFLALVVSVFIARNIGVEKFGQFTLFTSIFMIVSETPRALDTAFIRFAKSPVGIGNEAQYHAASLIVKFVYSAAIGCLGWLLAPYLANNLFQKMEAAETVGFGFLAGGIFSIYTSLGAWYQFHNNFIKVAICRPMFYVIICLCLGFFSITGISVMPRYILHLYSVTAFGLSSVVLFSFRGQLIANFKIALRQLIPFLRIGGILMASGLVAMVSNRLDVFFLTRNLSFTDIGIYGAAIRITSIASIMTGAISIIMLPKAASVVHEPNRLKRYLQLSLFYALIQITLVVILISLLKPLILITLGQNFVSSKKIATILIFQILLISFGEPFKALIQCSKKPQWETVLSFLRLALSSILLYMMIRLFGLQGAAYAVTITAGLITMSTIFIALRQINNI